MRTHSKLSRLAILLLSLTAAELSAATLTAFAVLPADSFTDGPTSGQLIQPVNGRTPPFESQQPIQGFSAVVQGENDSFFILSDNGYGRRDNSSDYLLSIYHINPYFRTQHGGSGDIRVNKIIHLSDPQRFLPYPATLEKERSLTGADLDPESFRRVSDGSFWIGEEFNPSLVHFSEEGEMLASPFMLNGLFSEGNPSGKQATLPRSRGFEGMASSPDGKRLYPMLESALIDAGTGLNIYTFDIESQRFLNSDAHQPSYRYRLDEDASAIGDFTMYSVSGGLVIERDSKEGKNARVKKIYQVDFGHLDSEGFMIKTLVADLLNIQDPYDLDQDGKLLFAFPFWTIEGLVVLNRTTLGIVNDNNYPLGQARDNSGTQPDSNEFILIAVDPLWE